MPLRKSTIKAAAPAAAPPAVEEQLPLNVSAAEAEPKPKAKRGRKPKAASAEQPAAEQPATEAAAITTAAPMNAIVLPPLDAPAVNADEPAISYKIDFSDRSSWHASTDGGETKQAIGSKAVAGMPVDLILQISKAKRPKGHYTHDYRLRLAFYQQDSQLAELNLTAINVAESGELYTTSPARSLVGALLAISESEDDMLAFCDGARFSIKPGTGRGVFIETDIAYGQGWTAMASATNTSGASKDASGLLTQLALIKHRFRSIGLLLTSQAVSGENPLDDDVVDTTAEAV